MAGSDVDEAEHVHHVQAAVDDPRRRIVLDGVHNFRDLGGYPAAGGTTRWGRVYRADGLNQLTPADVEVLRQRGVGTVIDLRTETELIERGRFPVERHQVRFHHLPVLDRTWDADLPAFDNDHDLLLWAYNDMLRIGAPMLAAGLKVIAEADSTPLVFHCAAGKDRTGLLAALLLSVLGVPEPFVAADYAKTAEGMTSMLAMWRAMARDKRPGATERAARLDSVPQFFFASPPEVMVTLLRQISAQHGSVVDFVRSLGVTDDHMAALRGALIEPDA